MFLGLMMLYRDVAAVVDAINYLNQTTQIVWPGCFWYAKKKEYHSLIDVKTELESWEVLLKQYKQNNSIDIDAKISELIGDQIICKTFSENIKSLVQGQYKDITLNDRIWTDVYNDCVERDEEYDPAKDYAVLDEEEKNDLEVICEDGDWIPSDLLDNQDDSNYDVDKHMGRGTEHIDRLFEAVEQVKIYCEMFIEIVHPDTDIFAGVSDQHSAFANNEISSGSEDWIIIVIKY